MRINFLLLLATLLYYTSAFCQPPPPPSSFTDEPDTAVNREIGFISYSGMGLIVGKDNSSSSRYFQFQTVNGLHFGNNLMAGIGLGLTPDTDFDYYKMSVFGEVRIDLIEKRITPFFIMDGGISCPIYTGGYDTKLTPGILFGASVGVKRFKADKTAFTLSIGFIYDTYKRQEAKIYPNLNSYLPDKITSLGLNARLGWMFW